MAEKPDLNHIEYELGARKPVTRTWPDPIDDFSQGAANNKKPLHGGTGLSTDAAAHYGATVAAKVYPPTRSNH